MSGPNPNAFAAGVPATGGSFTGSINTTGIVNTGTITSTSTISTSGVASINAAGNLNSAVGSLDIQTAGQGLKVAEGSNAKQGIATLAAGTVVVSNTSVTANSRIFIIGQSLGTVTVFSAYGVSARTAGTSFTILASQATDTSVVAYEIFEPG